MLKNYIYIILLLFSFGSADTFAQESKGSNQRSQELIDGLNFYPNPVSNGKIYITSKSSLNKEVTIYDVLGKKVLQSNMTSKELNVSSLSPGVYIIKIKEGDASATRKLIVK
ncbi:T9SS type A sorting domain-containing protein [Flavobacterium sp. NST-5]|uniref:T9SS type A sorting domain-containing protein n=1 Tax=Flavobacterium ichthyis TaxID=2698827 RepID=A0ABW9ZBL7_9FLAO|nr:T9SS type A sorting domain-containing protein [Flavobacterium ichthyis]NBL66106.1 T9SS type A sorting domain-containing protein [Flavobacterium ichthyis]